MGYKFSPVGQGKHNNIHFRFTIKYKKESIISSNIVAFSDTGKAYIMSLKIKGIDKHLINLENLYGTISKNLNNFDFELVLLDKIGFESTEELLNYINN